MLCKLMPTVMPTSAMRGRVLTCTGLKNVEEGAVTLRDTLLPVLITDKFDLFI